MMRLGPATIYCFGLQASQGTQYEHNIVLVGRTLLLRTERAIPLFIVLRGHLFIEHASFTEVRLSDQGHLVSVNTLEHILVDCQHWCRICYDRHQR